MNFYLRNFPKTLLSERETREIVSEDIAMQIRERQTRAIPGAVNYRNNPAVNSYPRFITALDPLKLNS